MLSTTRSRSRNTFVQESYKQTFKLYGVTWTLNSPLSTGVIQTVSDNNNPRAIERMAKGEVIMSDCSISRNSTKITPGRLENWKFSLSGCLFERGGVGGTPVPFPDEPETESVDYLLVEAYAKMKESNLLVGEFMNDFRQTIGMLKRPFATSAELATKVVIRARELLRKQQSRPYKAGRRRLSIDEMATGAFSSAWLEYRYGWRPLAMDVKSIVKMAGEKLAAQRTLVARGRSSSVANGGWTWDPMMFGDMPASGSIQYSYKKSTNVGILYLVCLDQMAGVMRALGLRACDMPATAWEIMPYSFVADWFVGIGSWIKAISPSPGIVPLGNWSTIITDATTNTVKSCEWPIPVDESQWHGDYGSCEEKIFNMTRHCGNQLPTYPVVKKLGLSWQQQADALALLSGDAFTMMSRWRH